MAWFGKGKTEEQVKQDNTQWLVKQHPTEKDHKDRVNQVKEIKQPKPAQGDKK